MRGRAQHASGSFDEALISIVNARQISRNRGFDKLEATAKIHESWLLFYRGDRKKAFNLLDEAESVLLPTRHALSLGISLPPEAASIVIVILEIIAVPLSALIRLFRPIAVRYRTILILREL